MRRRTFLSALPAGALMAGAANAQQTQSAAAPSPAATSVQPAPTPDPYAGVGIGDRITGPRFVGRSTVRGANGRRKDRKSTRLNSRHAKISSAVVSMEPSVIAGLWQPSVHRDVAV